MKFRTALPVIAALSLAAPACQADMFKPSAKDQVKLGQRAADDLRKHEKIVAESDQRVKMLRRTAARLMANIPEAELQKWSFSFDVVDSKEINAFALPGGPVFFYTGLLDKLKTEDELAGVLGHEMTHVRKEHWASAYADSQKRRLGLSVLLILTKANSTLTNIASISDDLVFGLPYSRKSETQADDVGLDLMTSTGYNPQGMADVFEMMRQEIKGGRPPEFLNTHPDDKNRINRIEGRISKMGKAFPPQKPLPWAK